jgi:hypothetical protein
MPKVMFVRWQSSVKRQGVAVGAETAGDGAPDTSKRGAIPVVMFRPG